MKNYLSFFQLLISISLIGSILLQSQGGGLGGLAGSKSEFYRSRRGMEKLVFFLTIILAILFLVTSILSLVV